MTRTLTEIIGIVCIAVLGWFVYQKPVSGPVGQPQEATKAPEVAKMSKDEIKPAKVLGYSQDAKQKVKIPESAKKDPAIVVLDSSTIPPSDHPITFTESLNINTGETTAHITTDPYPWLAMENEKRFTFAYGLKNGGVKAFRFQYSHELVQVNALHAGPLVTIDTDGKGFAGLAVRW
jgi:hypothetical protein